MTKRNPWLRNLDQLAVYCGVLANLAEVTRYIAACTASQISVGTLARAIWRTADETWHLHVEPQAERILIVACKRGGDWRKLDGWQPAASQILPREITDFMLLTRTEDGYTYHASDWPAFLIVVQNSAPVTHYHHDRRGRHIVSVRQAVTRVSAMRQGLHLACNRTQGVTLWFPFRASEFEQALEAVDEMAYHMAQVGADHGNADPYTADVAQGDG